MNLAFCGAIVSTLGFISSMFIFAAFQKHKIEYVYIGAALYATMAPIWYKVYCMSHGAYINATVTASLCGAIFAIIFALITKQRQTTLEWVGFLIIIFGFLLRSVSHLLVMKE